MIWLRASSPDRLIIKSKDCRVQLSMNVYLQSLRPMFNHRITTIDEKIAFNSAKWRALFSLFLFFRFAAIASFGDCDKQLKSNC